MGKNVRAGRAFMEFFIDDKKLRRGLAAIQTELRGVGRGIASVGGAITGAAVGAGAAFVPAIREAADAQEIMSKFEVVFGDQSAAVKSFGDDLAQQIGRSKTLVAEFLAGAQDLFVPIGFDAKKAERLSKTITQLTFDLASFNNKADADVMRDLQAAMTGSSEVMKKYGVIVNETAVKQELLNRGLSKEQLKNVTEQQKVLARLAIILRGTTAAQGDAARTASSFTNAMKGLRGAASDALAAIGRPLSDALAPMVTGLAAGVRSISEFVERNQSFVATGAKIVGVVGAIGAGMLAAGTVIVALSAGMGTIGTVAAGVVSGLGAIASLVAGLVSPLGLLAATVAVLAVRFVDWGAVASSVANSVRRALGTLLEFAGTTIRAVQEALAGGSIEAAGRVLFASLDVVWTQGVAKLGSIWRGWRQAFVETFVGAFGAIKKAWVEVQTFLANSVLTLAAGIAEILSRVFPSNSDFAKQLRSTAENFVDAKQVTGDDRNAAIAKIDREIGETLGALAQSDVQSLRDAQQRLTAARDEWSAAIAASAEAKRAAEEARANGEGSAQVDFQAIAADLGKGLKEAGKVASASIEAGRGTFLGSLAGRSFAGADRVETQQLDVQRQQLAEQKRTNRHLDEAGPLVFG